MAYWENIGFDPLPEALLAKGDTKLTCCAKSPKYP
jgi:hypothetical protein